MLYVVRCEILVDHNIIAVQVEEGIEAAGTKAVIKAVSEILDHN